MEVLIIGSGGREHALAWKIAQSSRVDKIYCAPGNGGIAEIAECVDIEAKDIKSLASFAINKSIDLTVVGPEIPLVYGIVDLFESKGLRIFGPHKNAAVLEGSKVFSKELMLKYNIPTARAGIFDKIRNAKEYIDDAGVPVVVKADGLAAGKGVVVCNSSKEAKGAIDNIMQDKVFGDAGDKIIIEECLEGEEASILVLSDGKNIVPLVNSQDHKQIFDGDKGPNTGGMGAYSPAPLVTDELLKEVMEKIVKPTISAMEKEGRAYKGVLYVGVMVTKDGPKTLEFNARFGDPETQAILPRLKDDLVDIISEVIEGKLTRRELTWDNRACASVVLASGGYPGEYEKGKVISGLDEVKQLKDVVVFHAGTKKTPEGECVTNGGRVLNVSALADNIEEAVKKAYKTVDKIHFDNVYYRRDIGYKAITRKEQVK